MSQTSSSSHPAWQSRPPLGHDRLDSSDSLPIYNTFAHRPASGIATPDSGSRPSTAGTQKLRLRDQFDPARILSHEKDLPAVPTPGEDMSATSEASTSNRESAAASDTEGFYKVVRPRNLSRAGSVYSLSRVSFTSQISQLTSIKLPEASSLSGSISSIQTAPKAARALEDAADQIQAWINKASDVLEGLDAKDEVDWAAAAGRDGLGEVDQAINRFGSLIQVYITAVENIQSRQDVSNIPSAEMKRVVGQVEKVAGEWQHVKGSLKSVKKQVELAIEWESLRNSIFEDIGQELDALSRLVFEMEERRHMADSAELPREENNANVDISELETIMEDGPSTLTNTDQSPAKLSTPHPFPRASPSETPSSAVVQEDTNLLGLFARMQPLRAQLDFLPMRLAAFQGRANDEFPTACRELQDRRQALEQQCERLETDAESLRRELGEDRWLLVFRNAGKQAMKMIGSVERSITKLDEALDSNTQFRHAPTTLKKIESYEAKKKHFIPAIERVLAIVERGVKDRLTVNGEILRLQTDMQQRWRATLADVRNMDSTLDFYDANKTQQLRDSISSVLSSDKSYMSSNVDSSDSSPLSSVGPQSRNASRHRPEPPAAPYPEGKPSTIVPTTEAAPSTPAAHRHVSEPLSESHIPLKTLLTRSSALDTARSVSSPSAKRIPSTPTTPRSLKPSPKSAGPGNSADRPRWNTSTRADGVTGHNFRPLAATDVSPYRKPPPIKHTPTVRSSTSMRNLSSNAPSASQSPTNSRRTSAQLLPSPATLRHLSPSAPGTRRLSGLSAASSVVLDFDDTASSTTAPADRDPDASPRTPRADADSTASPHATPSPLASRRTTGALPPASKPKQKDKYAHVQSSGYGQSRKPSAQQQQEPQP